MSKEILLVAEAVSNEKGVSKEIIFEAIELALAAAAKKRFEEECGEPTVEVRIDRKTGEYKNLSRWNVVSDDEMAGLGDELTLEKAHEYDPLLKAGDVYEIEIDNPGFGRIAAQAAKQIIVQKVREAERAQIVEEYQARLGESVNGTVKKVTRDKIGRASCRERE